MTPNQNNVESLQTSVRTQEDGLQSSSWWASTVVPGLSSFWCYEWSHDRHSAELNDHLSGTQRSSSHFACAIHVVEICVHSHQNSKKMWENLHHKPKIMHVNVKQPIEKHCRSSRHCLSLTGCENDGLSGAPEGIPFCGLCQLSSSLSSKSSSLSLKPPNLSLESAEAMCTVF